ncbi:MULTISPECIES: pseudouridine synthase [unclassified Neptuniibacter]|uniref:pseudouridine synthase n=1 Tax=unclassified Neptuniibacter TaxID=2630693 RepID=UPI000C3FCBA4|nr:MULTISPECIES: pseudouridine synthase [unclassified Neptuniibacter]MAY42089.1 RNA pseudouridine synthase [Oceanospirillaceae bacterium]|tara:strand:- start:19377 stop:19997 length:621 start_codon:yes stop_codon:yes gene_type:complete
MVDIIYSDSSLVIANKPWDMLSVPGRGEDKQDCLWRRVQAEFPTARVVHRLDYATSGLMVLALTLEAQRDISRSFQERKTGKLYQAIISGKPSEKQGSVDLPLICDWENRPLQIVDHEHGKNALTHWKATGEDSRGTRVELTPITGRSHQLRVHMQAMGHPIIGDRFYADEDSKALSDRLLLHAERLSFPHPETGKVVEFTVPCPF